MFITVITKQNSVALVRLSVKLVPAFADRGFRVVGATYVFFKELLNCTHEAKWTPFQTHHFSENLVAPEIEPGPSLSVARNSDH
jgi:hypothetical protein